MDILIIITILFSVIVMYFIYSLILSDTLKTEKTIASKINNLENRIDNKLKMLSIDLNKIQKHQKQITDATIMNEQHILNKFSECQNSPNCFVGGITEDAKLFYMSPINKTSNNDSVYDNNVIFEVVNKEEENNENNNEVVVNDEGNEIPRFENIDD